MENEREIGGEGRGGMGDEVWKEREREKEKEREQPDS